MLVDYDYDDYDTADHDGHEDPAAIADPACVKCLGHGGEPDVDDDGRPYWSFCRCTGR